MTNRGRLIAMLVVAIAAGSLWGLAVPVGGAQAKTCQTPAGHYDVTAPRAASSEGADPAEVAAANCTLGFHEEQAYPLSVIALALLATIGALMLARRRRSHDVVGSEA